MKWIDVGQNVSIKFSISYDSLAFLTVQLFHANVLEAFGWDGIIISFGIRNPAIISNWLDLLSLFQKT